MDNLNYDDYIIVYISIGSNLGNRLDNLNTCLKLLNSSQNFIIDKVSSFYETQPWNMDNISSNWFLNAAIKAKTKFEPEKLLDYIKSIEHSMGRKDINQSNWKDKNRKFLPRIIDIDILFYGDKIISTQRLIIPHSQIQYRAFVLVPMLEIAIDFVHPILNANIEELYENLDDVQDVFLYGTIVEKQNEN